MLTISFAAALDYRTECTCSTANASACRVECACSCSTFVPNNSHTLKKNNQMAQSKIMAAPRNVDAVSPLALSSKVANQMANTLTSQADHKMTDQEARFQSKHLTTSILKAHSTMTRSCALQASVAESSPASKFSHGDNFQNYVTR